MTFGGNLRLLIVKKILCGVLGLFEFPRAEYVVCAIVLGAVVSVAGCSSVSVQTQHPLMADKNVQDSGPAQPMDVDHIPDPVPHREPLSRSGNKTPYRVLGRTYHIDFDTQGFVQRGKASWYGKKFHGKLTANGEIYNMYGMTAAHKTLPLPTFVRVTNTDNQRSVIVRVNDRGPFHGDRVIDLTYSAAKKLGFVSAGTANVEVRVISESEYADIKPQFVDTNISTVSGGVSGQAGGAIAPPPRHSGGYELPPNTYLQIGAFSIMESAHKLRERIRGMTQRPVEIEWLPERALHKVLVGPFSNGYEMAILQEQLEALGLGQPHILYR